MAIRCPNHLINQLGAEGLAPLHHAVESCIKEPPQDMKEEAWTITLPLTLALTLALPRAYPLLREPCLALACSETLHTPLPSPSSIPLPPQPCRFAGVDRYGGGDPGS